MERNEVIKALECCNSPVLFCDDCPLRPKYSVECSNIMEYSFALIKELTEDNEAQSKTITNLLETIKSIQADTVRKMQERLKEKLEHYPQRCGDCFKEKVDQIAKEILGGEQ